MILTILNFIIEIYFINNLNTLSLIIDERKKNRNQHCSFDFTNNDPNYFTCSKCWNLWR